MITEHDSDDVILSLFPETRARSGPNTQLDKAKTLAREDGRLPDKKFTVHVPDDAAFDKAVANHTARKIWNWLPTNDNETHCGRSAYDALKAGGIPLQGQDKGQILPGTLEDLLYELSKKSSPKNSWEVNKIIIFVWIHSSYLFRGICEKYIILGGIGTFSTWNC